MNPEFVVSMTVVVAWNFLKAQRLLIENVRSRGIAASQKLRARRCLKLTHSIGQLQKSLQQQMRH